jgi:hypothetical protein
MMVYPSSRSTFDTEKSWPQNKLGLVDAEVRGKKSGPVPRYFFIVQGESLMIEDDPRGTILPDTAAAQSYAERTIRELRGEDRYNDPLLIMIVKDESNHTVLSLPFLPACA